MCRRSWHHDGEGTIDPKIWMNEGPSVVGAVRQDAMSPRVGGRWRRARSLTGALRAMSLTRGTARHVSNGGAARQLSNGGAARHVSVLGRSPPS